MEKSVVLKIGNARVELTLSFTGQSYMVEHETLGDIGSLAIKDEEITTLPDHQEWGSLEMAIRHLIQIARPLEAREVKVMNRAVVNTKGQTLRYIVGSKETNDKDVTTLGYTYTDAKGNVKEGTMKLEAWNELPKYEESEEEKAARKKTRRQERRKARRAAKEAATEENGEGGDEEMQDADLVLGPEEDDDDEGEDEE